MSKTTQNTFMKLFKTDVSKYTEKKGKFTYLSWCFAVQELIFFGRILMQSINRDCLCLKREYHRFKIGTVIIANF